MLVGNDKRGISATFTKEMMNVGGLFYYREFGTGKADKHHTCNYRLCHFHTLSGIFPKYILHRQIDFYSLLTQPRFYLKFGIVTNINSMPMLMIRRS